MSDPRKDFVGHGQVPVNVVQSRLLIVSMGEGDSRTGDLEAVSYTHLPSPRDGLLSRMPSSA